ncbi:DMT family transporter [uncultured Duncaniella sp.]|uniref:DMT family transporter n=1 Tax=uncultured Duncaniella sp. TaxID=2768039 RepID=UPI0025D80ECC|nr:DMT family transporter [uncultured Duncaniella sp.]
MKVFNLKGHAAMLGANTMWGLMAPVAKMVMAAGIVSPLLMTSFRILGAALLFWTASLFVPDEKVPPRDLLLMAGAAMLGILFNQGCYVFGVGFTSPGEASIITTTMPLWVMVFAAFILGEPITLKKIGGIVLGATGALILVLGASKTGARGDNPTLGDILVLTAQISYALYLTFYRNFIKKYSVVTLMKWMFTFASVAILPVSIGTMASTSWGDFTPREIFGVGYVVFFATFLSYICVMVGQKNLRPTLVGMYNYVQPIVASCVGIWLGLDVVTFPKVVAVALIFTGVFLVTISKAAPQGEPAHSGRPG